MVGTVRKNKRELHTEFVETKIRPILEEEEILGILYGLPEDPATSDVEGDFVIDFVHDIISEVFPPSTYRKDL
ncbi:hypothetical protein J6590_083772 [Homalodisca vitripennis]|nr:hypothetical protein J6590_083772 [Homalodisca vitripennis]